jgi:NADH:ubiquinone oxidoreductase subunit F (NADH-binding)/NADH:ubiquinone oxidoreductase subunit E/NAD-dependent dihydropyrimidine dehydrogenase PreA subunit
MAEHRENINECGCDKISNEDIRAVVEDVVASVGRGRQTVIPVLQEIQKRLNWIPSEALRHLTSITEITPGQLSGVSTFYSQFRHIPAGRHTIKICKGTACHVKGAGLISDAFRRTLKIGDETSTSADGLFSVEEVACLGCCTLAPVVQIDEKTYGHVKPTETEIIIKDFLESAKTGKSNPKTTINEITGPEIRVGLGSCCVAGGSREVLGEILEVRDKYSLSVNLKPVGCVGVCNQTPLLEIAEPGKKEIRYVKVRKEEVEDIIVKHIKPKSFDNKIRLFLNDFADSFVSDRKLNSPVNLADENREKILTDYQHRQFRMATVHSGVLSPESIDEYMLLDGFSAFRNSLKEHDKGRIVSAIVESGLRGRGGAGFPTGKKWQLFRESYSETKYIICNGDEGDPGAFMDRMLLESFPFRIIEGMMIAAVATGATEGIFYIRAEYPLAVQRIRYAIEKCYSYGLLGNEIEKSNFSFNIRIFEGAGAFVCGEETALIASIEGKRGSPHLRPPYPVTKGLNGKPTLVNNVETLSLVPWIISNGASAFRSKGTEGSSGTKVFALAGKVLKGGLIEVPMGTAVREIVEGIGGGVEPGRKFKAVQIGGPSGGCIPESLADTRVDFGELNRLGAMMGSGGLVVLDDTDCMVDMAKYFLTFTHQQSCGKCTFCRVGTRKMLEIITNISEGRAKPEDLDSLEALCHSVKNGSLCGLGKTAPNPVLTGLMYFRDEYLEHTKGNCPAKKCRELIKYTITDECTGCTKCSQDCPVDAIPFKPYEKHSIIQDLCTKCDNCRIVCPENAVIISGINDQA